MSVRRTVGGLALALAIPAGLSAQETGRVSGSVLDRTGGEPLGGALVLLDAGRRTVTDREGRFSLEGVAPGRYRIAAVSRGCAHVIGVIDVVAGREKLVELVVAAPPTEGTAELEEPAGVQVLRGDDLRGSDATSLMDVLRRRAPDLVRPGADGRAMLRSRGQNSVQGSGEPVLVVDGTRIRADVVQVLESMSPQDVRRLEIRRGAAGGWAYGMDSARGVIEVTTEAGSQEDPSRPARTCPFVWPGA